MWAVRAAVWWFRTDANSLVLLFAAAAQPKHLQSSVPMSYCPVESQPIRSVWLVRVNWFAMRSKCSTERPPIGSAAPDNSMARNGNWSAGPTARPHSLTSICPHSHSSSYLSLSRCPDAAKTRSPIAARPRRMARIRIDRRILFAQCGPLASWLWHVCQARHTTSGDQDPAKEIQFLAPASNGYKSCRWSIATHRDEKSNWEEFDRSHVIQLGDFCFFQNSLCEKITGSHQGASLNRKWKGEKAFCNASNTGLCEYKRIPVALVSKPDTFGAFSDICRRIGGYPSNFARTEASVSITFFIFCSPTVWSSNTSENNK